MADELWNEKLTRENLKDFYEATVDMVFSSVFGVTKEATRCERAIVKSYLDIYAKRANIPGDRVIYDFGDILLENAKAVVAEYPLPADITFQERKLDEYTRNSMIEKIIANEPKAAPKFTMDESVKDFYAFTRDSFKVEGYDPAPFTDKIPVAI